MDKESIIQKTAEHVKKQMMGEGTGHDWWHVYRVWKTAKHIGKEEKADLFIVELAALLHDLADWKLYKGDDLKPIRDWLETLEIDKETADRVCEIVKNVSFKGAGVRSEITKTKEGMVVQDADRLDAIGAIGIARALAYGGHKGREIHNPDIKPVEHKTFEEYKSSKGTTINHFYEKLLLLKDRMKTGTGKNMAEERHAFMESYLKEFYKEWEGNA
jgi:uncharacterized protein